MAKFETFTAVSIGSFWGYYFFDANLGIALGMIAGSGLSLVLVSPWKQE